MQAAELELLDGLSRKQLCWKSKQWDASVCSTGKEKVERRCASLVR